MLLGADRENVTDRNKGWQSVAQCWADRGLGRSSVLKVAHHGSPNGDSDVIWSQMVEPDPHALVAPYYRGNGGGRPRLEDVERICSRTSRAYITSVGRLGRPLPAASWDQDNLYDLNAALGIKIELAQPPLGHIRMRAERDGGDWNVDLFPPAARLRTSTDR